MRLAGLDWHSVALSFADSIERPLFALDPSDVVRVYNHALECLLGWDRHQIVGRRWDAAFDVPATDDLARILDGVRSGARIQGQLPARTRGGRLVTLEVALRAVGARGMVGTVEQVRDAPRAAIADDASIEISVRDEDFGTIRRGAGGSGRPCYAVFANRASPCASCPCRLDAVQPRVAVMQAADGTSFVVQATPLSADACEVRHYALEDGTLARMFRGRLEVFSARAGLSGREREVLEELLGGGSVEAIAARLRISPRTVKFHQANVLAKLGLESRLELMRLIVEPWDRLS